MISWLSQTTLLKMSGPADSLYSTSRRSGPFFRNMLHNSLFKLLFCQGWTIAMLFWKGKGKGSGVWPSMVTHTQNLSSAFNPSKCTLTAVNTHLEQWAAILRRPGSSWGIGALLKGLTSVVVLKVERALVIHSPHLQSLPDLGIEPATFGLQVQLSNH